MAKAKTRKPRTRKMHKDTEALTFWEGFRWAIAVALFLTALAMLLAYTSFLLAGAGNSMQPSHNWLGGIGVWLSQTMFESGFGVASYLIPVFLLAVSVRILGIGRVRLWVWFLNCAFLMVWLSVAGAWLQQLPPLKSFFLAGGIHGISALQYLLSTIGTVGTFLILCISALVYILYASGELIRSIRRAIEAAKRQADKHANAKSIEELLETNEAAQPEAEEEQASDEADHATATTIEFAGSPEGDAPHSEPEAGKMGDEERELPSTPQDMEIEVPEGEEPQVTQETGGDKLTIGTDEPQANLTDERTLEPYDPKLDLENYHYPTIDLLKKYDTHGTSVDLAEQHKNKDQILSLFANFGVEISAIKATVGPTVTLYEVTPAPGVRISKIRNLEDEIALRLCALGIRIIAPIPGKGTVGIEVPNAKPQMVSMESVINSRKFQETDYELPMALGKTITNEIFMVDLAKMPHLLVAGATGQGKSVGLNAIITSLLYKKHPAELKLVMVDPKKVEFSVYYPIVNHFLAQVEGTEDTDEPIITDVKKVVQTLRSLCQEMDSRYDLLKRARARNVKEYNAKFKARQLNPENGHRFMPYIVVIIDEFGDLIMTAGKEIELPIARIAQLARAVGIHMIIATQRPAANIITGAIRANFPARMAFKVSQMIESRIILDRPGANRLVGKGDMLFLAGNEPVRVQCAFVDTPEVESICNYIASQQSYPHPFLLPEVVEDTDDAGGKESADVGPIDPMFEKVARLIVGSQEGSTSRIQREFSVGYNRAGRLMDQLEKAGIVGPARGSKPREVLCHSDADLDYILSNLR
ncbi:MAG: DNA translocase FtsK [Prevotellaceae bacterium]|nr:DNA translocase FtsK [Prevotellaceae bacterium]